jgi:hypothetical protein
VRARDARRTAQRATVSDFLLEARCSPMTTPSMACVLRVYF